MIEILPRNSEEEVLEGLDNTNNGLNTYICRSGKTVRSVKNIVIYNDENGEVIGKLKWFSSKFNSNNTTKGVKIPGIRLVKDVDKAIKKCVPFLYNLKGNGREKECEVYIPLSELKGEIIKKTEIIGTKEYQMTYYKEEDTNIYVSISSEFIKDNFNSNREIDNLIKRLELLKDTQEIKNRSEFIEAVSSIL